MLLKNFSLLFKAFGQSVEMDFFSSQVHQFVFVCFILYYLYIKRANDLKLQCFWFVQLALFHRLLFFSFSSFTTLFLICLIRNVSQNNKILTQQIGTIFSQLLRC